MKTIKNKFKNFFSALKSIELRHWMEVGFIILFTFWIAMCCIFNDMLILIVIPSIILSIFYICAYVSLCNISKDNRERKRSIEEHNICKHFKDCDIGSYNDYVVKSSEEYVKCIFEKDMNLGIYCAAVDFLTKDIINSLYSLHLFEDYIKHNWKNYENKEVYFYCFLVYAGLNKEHTFSMAPFADISFCHYDSTFLENNASYNFAELIELPEKKVLFNNLSEDFKSYYSTKDFRIDFSSENYEDLNKLIVSIQENNNIPIFMKVNGILDKEENRIMIKNCTYEETEYYKYISMLKEKQHKVFLSSILTEK